MKKEFNWDDFEKLKGLPLARYVINNAEGGNLPKDYMEYAKRNADRLDVQHLEMLIFILDKIGSDETRHEIAKYLGHPLEPIRLMVIGLFDKMDSLDDYSLSKIRERLASVASEFEKSALIKLQTKSSKKF